MTIEIWLNFDCEMDSPACSCVGIRYIQNFAMLNTSKPEIEHRAFRHVETLFAQGNQVRTDQTKPPCLVIKNGGLI